MKSHCRTYYASTVRIETQPSDDCSKTSENHRKLGVSNQNRGFRDHKTRQNRLPKPRPKPLQNRSRKPALNSPITWRGSSLVQVINDRNYSVFVILHALLSSSSSRLDICHGRLDIDVFVVLVWTRCHRHRCLAVAFAMGVSSSSSSSSSCLGICHRRLDVVAFVDLAWTRCRVGRGG